jgi:hypothetical protein
MSTTLVWAFKPLDVLHGETGFVECDEELAAQLIASGDAQDTRDGALHFKEIEIGKHQEYDTKVMTAKRGRPAKAE